MLIKTLLGATIAILFALPALAADTIIRIAYESDPGEPADMVMHRRPELVDAPSGGR